MLFRSGSLLSQRSWLAPEGFLPADTRGAKALAWNPAGTALAMAQLRGKTAGFRIRIFDWPTGLERKVEFLAAAAAISRLQFSPDGERLQLIAADSQVFEWRLDGTRMPSSILKISPNSQISADGRRELVFSNGVLRLLPRRATNAESYHEEERSFPDEG